MKAPALGRASLSLITVQLPFRQINHWYGFHTSPKSGKVQRTTDATIHHIHRSFQHIWSGQSWWALPNAWQNQLHPKTSASQLSIPQEHQCVNPFWQQHLQWVSVQWRSKTRLHACSYTVWHLLTLVLDSAFQDWKTGVLLHTHSCGKLFNVSILYAKTLLTKQPWLLTLRMAYRLW